MNITVDAIVENGFLKPLRPIPLKDQEIVQVTIQSKRNWVQETQGILGWTGGAELAERFASDPDLDHSHRA